MYLELRIIGLAVRLGRGVGRKSQLRTLKRPRHRACRWQQTHQTCGVWTASRVTVCHAAAQLVGSPPVQWSQLTLQTSLCSTVFLHHMGAVLWQKSQLGTAALCRNAGQDRCSGRIFHEHGCRAQEARRFAAQPGETRTIYISQTSQPFDASCLVVGKRAFNDNENGNKVWQNVLLGHSL